MSKTAETIHSEHLSSLGLRLAPIRALRDEQRLELLELRNLPDIRGNMYDCSVISAPNHLNWCAKVAESETDHIHILMQADTIVGQLGFRDISWANSRCDWAFYLSDSLRGRGIGKALEVVALKHVFEDLRLNKLNCEVIDFNQAVVAMHKSFGFEVEGVRKEHVRRESTFHDAILLGMTAKAYFENR